MAKKGNGHDKGNDRDMDRMVHEIDSTRREASQTIHEIKTEAKLEGEKLKSEIKHKLAQTSDKVGSKMRAAVVRSKSSGRRSLSKLEEERFKSLLFIGAGLITAGLILTLGSMVMRKKTEAAEYERSAEADQMTEQLEKIRMEAEADRMNRAIITPSEYEDEIAEETAFRLKDLDTTPL